MSTISRALGVARSNFYSRRSSDNSSATAVIKRLRGTDDEALANAIRDILESRPTYRYRRITAILRRDGRFRVNHKRVYRVMKSEQLLLQRSSGKPHRTHEGKIITLHSNTRWCTDAFGIQCWNGETLQVAFSMDYCDREVISWVTSTRGIDGELVRDLMTESVEKRFQGAHTTPHSMQWLSDNGPGYTARQTVFHGHQLGFEICTTPSYGLESNGMAEAFVKTFKRDYVYVNDLRSAEAVKNQLAAWFEDYNENAPPMRLRMLLARQYLAAQQA